MPDIQKWRKKNLEQKTNYKGYNSFIASEPFEDFHADLAFFTDLKNDKYVGMLVVIDITTKYATCVPIRNKQPDEILNAFRIAGEDVREAEELLRPIKLRLCSKASGGRQKSRPHHN